MSRSIVITTLLAAALAPAATAQAAPHWSSPRQVIAPPGGEYVSIGQPQARFGANGSPLGFGGDGANPVVLGGSIAGGLKATKLSATTAGVARGAVGADGTGAAVWTDTGTARLAIAPPGGGYGAPVDLPGAGVNAVDVAVGADGTTTVIWRTHGPDGTYDALVAQAPKGGGLGAPQTLDTGKSPIGSVDVAAGPGGAVAFAYTRNATVARTKIAVKPAGVGAFEAAQPVSGAAKTDLAPQVVFNSDGTIVAAWSNSDGAQAAFRRPGQTVFEAPVVLPGPGGYNLTLEPTPQGGAALAYVGGNAVYAAVQAPGAGLAPAVIAPAPGNIPPAPAIGVDAAGTATVVYSESQSGEVRAVTLGGGSTLVAYGKAGSLTPVAYAAGAANQGFALWVDADGGLSSATYGEDAPANTGPGGKPKGADRKAPKVTWVGSKRLTVTSKTTALKLTLTVDEAAAIGVSGSLRTTVRGKRYVGPITTLDIRKQKVGKAGKRTVTLKLGQLALKDLRRALKAGKGAQAFLVIDARDAAQNSRSSRVQLSLKPKAKKQKKR